MHQLNLQQQDNIFPSFGNTYKHILKDKITIDHRSELN